MSTSNSKTKSKVVKLQNVTPSIENASPPQVEVLKPTNKKSGPVKSTIKTAPTVAVKVNASKVAKSVKAKSISAKKLTSQTVVESPRALTGKGTPSAQPTKAKADAKLEKKLASEPPRALKSPIRIFQIYFEPWQRELLDPAFYPLDNSRGTSELLEFAVFEQLQRNAVTEGAMLWGALSWRFGEKAGIQGAEWVKQIVDHPGNDVYYCNPHPLNEALFHNMWLQGETAHPDFLALCKSFFNAAGLDESELISVQTSGSYSAANYFVASPKFWQRYLTFVRKTLAAADKAMPAKDRDLLHSRMADDRNLHGGATYLPFVVERLFPVFMRSEGKDLKAYKIALPERERELNVHLKLLREMKDVSHRTQSAWLAACWVNYRNLYLSQTNGKAWCEKYLRSITPTEVRFA